MFIDVEDVTFAAQQNGSEPFKGLLEEVIVYNKVIYPISPGAESFIMRTPLQEIESEGFVNVMTGPRSYTCRLFMKDYHNVRGSTSREVATSAPVQLKKAVFRIQTG